jgi:hypothetical protein
MPNHLQSQLAWGLRISRCHPRHRWRGRACPILSGVLAIGLPSRTDFRLTDVRRGVSILLILFFGLGPLSEALPAAQDSRLPPCCRRHGAHHCAMSDAAIARATSSPTPILAAPVHCPFYPDSAPARINSCHALAVTATIPFVLVAGAHSPIACHPAARSSQIWTNAGRGPPNPIIG